MIQWMGKNKADKDPFLRRSSVPGCETWTRLYLIPSVQFPSMDKWSALCKDVGRKNRSGAHKYSIACFNVICFFCGIVLRYLWKKIAPYSLTLRLKQHMVRLKLHIVIFSTSICGQFHSERRSFFCTMYTMQFFPQFLPVS